MGYTSVTKQQVKCLTSEIYCLNEGVRGSN